MLLSGLSMAMRLSTAQGHTCNAAVLLICRGSCAHISAQTGHVLIGLTWASAMAEALIAPLAEGRPARHFLPKLQ